MSSAFDKLARPVQKWIRQQGWRELRDIQARSIRTICETDADLIVAASTAGGKTEAAFLPLISQVFDDPFDGTGFDLLYIGPLKALITDQAIRLASICPEAELPVVPWHGDVSQSIKTRALKSPKGILLITPESLEALFIRRGLEISRLFGATRAVVIDELHTVLDSERGVQLRSLLTRLELTIKRPIRRIGLSATLGDMDLAKAYLRPDAANAVQLIEADGGEAELRLQLRGYVSGDEGENSPSATDAIAAHLFKHLRGSDNLVFAGARQRVEIYADRLRELCEREHLPQEFYPHHASLSREHRDFVEHRLKDAAKPTTAVCTSTLELGIDIGDVTCVAQIGAPFSVAALRQRLGRSGRREGQPAVLRQYAVETQLTPESSFVDRLRLGLIRSIAMIDLLLEGWCEPARPQALHLSTLVHQILSVIAQRGGASASVVYSILCREGPFRKVTTEVFADVLRSIGHTETGLIEQSGSGLLLLGPAGEKLVEHYSFYAVFQTPEEFRLVAEGKDLGTLPIDNVLAPGMLLIFSGRRWVVQEIHDREKVIMVKPAKAGVPPVFGGDPGDIHDKVIDRMFAVLEGGTQPAYMDAASLKMLAEARAHYDQLGFRATNIQALGEGTSIIATRVGTVKTSTLALALRSEGFSVERHDGFLLVEVGHETPNLQTVLADIRSGEPVDLFLEAGNLMSEKFHKYLSAKILHLDAVSSKLAPEILPQLANAIMRKGPAN
ncbi:DEAD/DEAH box helicase [Roseovarius indicus]|uniref:ATP-dependent helicase n=1 Tax=Roseovarius indicus TaxID=540747 RepID=A0A0T5P344_9RHOB|nr:DEAD/DEAH box helicase [Roseovarius indicus]KRS15578.1 ATP-dependent helicase [Roseovarius indicus]QEW25222.1 ATP-dependent helicase [Roseovarius indicus]SFE18761.1 ATP-dependent helicase Lhr and Lhr-like helicase [Roseovarius indicus]